MYNASAQRLPHPSRDSAQDMTGPSLQRQALASLDIFADVGVVQPPDLLPGPPGPPGPPNVVLGISSIVVGKQYRIPKISKSP